MSSTLQFRRSPTDRGRETVPWIEETRARGLLPPESPGRRPSLATANPRVEQSTWERSRFQEDSRTSRRSRSPSPEDWVRRNFTADQTPAFYCTNSPGHFSLREGLDLAAQLDASIARQVRKQSRQQTHTFEGVGTGRTVPICAIESDSEDDEGDYKPIRTFARPGSFHTRVYAVSQDDQTVSQRPSFEAQRRRQEAGEGVVYNIAVIQDEPENAQYIEDEANDQSAFQTAEGSLSASPQPSIGTVISQPLSPVSWVAHPSAEQSPTSPPPPCYVSEPGSPYPDSLLSRLGSITGLDLLGVDFALRDPSRPLPALHRGSTQLLSPQLLSPQASLPPSYHTSPYNPPVALTIITSLEEERPLPELPEQEAESPDMTQNYFSYPEASSSRTSYETTRPPVLAMPIAQPTGYDSRRYSAPAVPVHIGYRAPPPPPPPLVHYPTSPLTASAPPVPRRPNQPYVAPRPSTMPDKALRLRALSFASRSSLDRPLPPLPPERSQSADSQAISLGDVDSPTESRATSPVDEQQEEDDAPKPPPKPLLHYAYHPTHVSSYTKDVLPLPSSLHPDRHPLPSVIPMPPPPAAFQILAPSFEELLQRLFESGASRIEPTPDVFEEADEAELTAWLRFFKVTPADGESRSGRRRLPFRRKSHSQEYRVVLGLQLADLQALARIESSSSSRVPPSPSSSGPPVPPPGATSQSGPNPLLDLSSADDDTVLESTWFVPVTFTKPLSCPCSLATLGEALFKSEQESRQTGSRTDENGEKKLWQVIQSHRTRASSFTEYGVTNVTVTTSPSVKTTASSDVRFEDADLVSRGKTKGLFRKMTMAVADAGSGVGALRTVTRERERERDLRANFVTPFRPATPT